MAASDLALPLFLITPQQGLKGGFVNDLDS